MLSLTREEWDKLNKTISESGGFMREVSAELEGAVKGSFKQAINTLQVSLIEAYNSTEGAAGQLAGKLKETFGSVQFKESLTTIVTGMLGITNALVTMAPALAVAAGGWIALRAAMIGAAVWTSVSTALAGATLATQTLGAVAAGTATTLTGSTGILAAARMLPGVLGAAGASLIATTGLLAPLAIAIGAAGAAWYLFRDRTEETMNQSTAKVRTSTQEMISDLRKFQAEAGKLNAGTVRSRADAAFSATEGTWESLAKDRKEAAKRFGLSERDLTGDFNEYALAAKATSTYNIFPVLDAIKKKSAEAAAQREAALGLLKLAKKAEEDDLLIAKSAQVTSGTKNYEVGGGGGGGGRASREAAKLENANVLDLEKRYQAELKTIDAYYAKLEKIESTSAQYGIKTKEEAESKITALTEEHWTKRLEKVSTMSDEMSALLGKSVKLSEADAQKAKTFVATAQEEINTLKEKIEWIKEEARLRAEGAALKFNKDIDKNNVDLTKELELAKAAVYGKVSNPVERARNNAETLVSNRYAQMIQEAVDARIQAEQSGNEASIKATAERLELLDEEVKKAKQYYGDQYAALAEYQQTASYGWDQFWEKYEENATTAAKVVEQSLESVTKNIEDAFADMFKTGKFDAKKMVDSILSDVGRLVAKLAVSDLGNLFFGKGKPSGDVLGSIFGMGGNKEGGGIQSEGLSGLLTKATEGLKGFWDSLTGATSATIESTAKTVEDVLTMGTKKVAETSSTAALTELAAAAQMAATSLSTIGSTGGGGGGGVLGGLLGAIGGSGTSAASATADFVPYAWANGGAFRNGIQAFAKGGTFSNSIVRQPTLFRFADGTGMMGEAGPEAIMPLTRDSQGRLGVRYEGREAPQRRSDMKVTNNNISVSVNAPGGDPAQVRRSGAAVAREVAGAVAMSGRYR
jgi:lambda family phage tail tape measure protein